VRMRKQPPGAGAAAATALGEEGWVFVPVSAEAAVPAAAAVRVQAHAVKQPWQRMLLNKVCITCACSG
jgi:hypothetical protein